jgi:hypothetical protein
MRSAFSMRSVCIALVLAIAVAAGCGGRALESGGSVRGAGDPVASAGATSVGDGSAPVDGGATAIVWAACLCNAGAMSLGECAAGLKAGDACYQTTFTMCITEYPSCFCCGGLEAVSSPADSGVGGSNPCTGPCDVPHQTCDWAVNLQGGGVSTYMCCAQDGGGLIWTPGGCTAD